VLLLNFMEILQMFMVLRLEGDKLVSNCRQYHKSY
jgi:hypothetical protein